MTINTNPRLLSVPLVVLLCSIEVFLLTSEAFAGQKIDVDALPMKPVISAPSPELKWFKARFSLTWNELAENYSVEEVDRFLQRWRSTYPDDPEAWISSANWNGHQSQQSMLHLNTLEHGTFLTGKGADGDGGYVALHSQGGKPNNFLSVSTYTDANRLSKALHFYQEAQKRFPYRVDIYDNLAAFYFIQGQYNKQVDTLRTMSRTIMETDREPEGTNYQKLNVSKEQIMLNSFHKAFSVLNQENSEAALNAQLELALLTIQTLPDNPIAWNNLTAAYDRRGDKLAAYKAASKAYEIDQKDEIIVINLAKYCIELGFKEEAIKHYRWILSNSEYPGMKQRAREDLELLGASN